MPRLVVERARRALSLPAATKQAEAVIRKQHRATLILFAGPAWVAGDTINGGGATGKMVVVSGGQMVELAGNIARKARKTGTIVNTVAMMQPQAERAMAVLAMDSGGKFSTIDSSAKVTAKD